MADQQSFSLVLWTTDVFALAAFLEGVAGLVIEERHPGYAALRAGDVSIMLHADEAYRGHPWYDALMREGAARGIGAELRLRVADVEAAYTKAIRLGAQVIAAPYDSGLGFECSVMGPDGFLISLWHE
jgi:predicted enzyme related to lactoylglutathione lyase